MSNYGFHKKYRVISGLFETTVYAFTAAEAKFQVYGRNVPKGVKAISIK